MTFSNLGGLRRPAFGHRFRKETDGASDVTVLCIPLEDSHNELASAGKKYLTARMKRLSKPDVLTEKEEQWSPDGMIETLESYKDRAIGRVCFHDISRGFCLTGGSSIRK